MNVQKNGTAAGAGLVLGAAVLWGTVGPAQVMADSPLGTVALGGWRMLVGGVVLGALTARDRGRLRVLAARSAWVPLLVCALSTCLYQAAFLYSVSLTGAALATVVALGTAPVTTGVCAWWFTGERVGTSWLVSTGAATAGCALLLVPGGRPADALGLLLGVAAGACYGLYTVFAKRLAADNPAVHLPTVSAVSLTAGAAMLLPWMVTDTAGLSDTRTLGLVAWLGLATTVAAYWLFSAGLTRMSATAVGTLSLAEPLAAALLGVLVLGERLSATAVAGCVLMLIGLTAVSLPGVGRSSRRSAVVVTVGEGSNSGAHTGTLVASDVVGDDEVSWSPSGTGAGHAR
ncbi:DMT family transporter [Streptomyces sp. SAS_260]|uniref:DMT family transporter n=1 Tax=Streptomyces sp. SAS_260 TaxID=3412751 RepID=UPI00403CD922